MIVRRILLTEKKGDYLKCIFKDKKFWEQTDWDNYDYYWDNYDYYDDDWYYNDYYDWYSQEMEENVDYESIIEMHNIELEDKIIKGKKEKRTWIEIEKFYKRKLVG